MSCSTIPQFYRKFLKSTLHIQHPKLRWMVKHEVQSRFRAKLPPGVQVPKKLNEYQQRLMWCELLRFKHKVCIANWKLPW